jgi:hypothetical protein
LDLDACPNRATGLPHQSRDQDTRRGASPVTIAGSIFLVLIGAILFFAIDGRLSRVDLSTVGLILIIVGALGIALSLLQHAIWARRGRRRTP